MDLDIKSLQGTIEKLTDFSVTRSDPSDGQKKITVNITKTESNLHSYPLVLNENIFIYDDEEYVIKQLAEKTLGKSSTLSCTAIHKMIEDFNNHRIYDIKNGNMSLADSLKFIANGLGYTFQIDTSGLPNTVALENFGDDYTWNLFKSILEKFGAEFKIIGTIIIIQKEIGYKTENQFHYLFNIDQPQKEIDTTTLKTYIRGYGKTKDEKDIITDNSLSYDSRSGKYEIETGQNKLATSEVGATFKFSFSGTGFKFRTLVHFLGGKWEFVVDGSNSKTISTYKDVVAEVQTLDVIRGLENKTHSVVATFKGKDSNNPYTKGTNATPLNYLLDGNIITTYKLLVGDEVYTAVTEYTSPLATAYGLRHADPVKSDSITNKTDLTNECIKTLTDSITMSIKLTSTKIKDLGWNEIKRGDYVWCIIDPFDISTYIRVVEVEDYSDETKDAVYTLGTLKQNANKILAQYKKTSKTVQKITTSNNKVKSNAITIDSQTTFGAGYNPSTKVDVADIEQITESLAEMNEAISGKADNELASEVRSGLLSAALFKKLSSINVDEYGNVTVDFTEIQKALNDLEEELLTKASTSIASHTENGLMSSTDKTKLDQITTVTGQVYDLSSFIERLQIIEEKLEAIDGGGTT